MKNSFLILIVVSQFALVACNQTSIEDDVYEGRPHFRIETESATYYFDKAGGGLSRVIDNDGTDWVQYNGDPKAAAPGGAAGGFRGIPNMVYKLEDGAAGHPGFDQCISEKTDALFLLSPDAGHITGQTLVIDGGWSAVSPFPNSFDTLKSNLKEKRNPLTE